MCEFHEFPYLNNLISPVRDFQNICFQCHAIFQYVLYGLQLDERVLAYTRVPIYIISILQDLFFSLFSKGLKEKPSKQSTQQHHLAACEAFKSYHSQSIFSAKY